MGIAVLGPLRLDDAVLGRRDRIVLAALALRPGESVSADRLADAIWQDDVPPSAAKIVQGCVVRLRKRLGSGAVETSDHGYRLNLSLDEIDAHLFEREVRRARQLLEGGEPDRAFAVARDALRLWRGDPWPDLAAWDSARVDAARLAELHREAQELHCEALLATGHPDEVISLARALVGDEPLRERRWLVLARAQYQTGLQSDALATLRQVRMTLGRELGLDPGLEIVELETAILRQDPSLVASARRREPSTTCPYPGLTAYDVSDAETFFGREREVQTCLRRLASVPLLVVAGPSGSGKSSLVRAGVAAVLARSGRSVVTLTPGTHPMTELDRAAPGERAVLVVDQAEELVTLAADDERQAFLDYLLTRTDTAPVVLAVRTDHLGEIAGRPEVARRIEQGLYLLGPMDDTALRQAVEGPAHAAGLTLEPGLVELLVAEAGDQAGALPLLSHAMQETWTRREGGTLTVAGYRATGGIRGAIAQTAEGVYQQAGDERADVVRSLMLRLVASGPDGDPTPVHVPRRAIEDDVRIQGVVDLLIRSRLVTTDGGTLTIAHEALARAWPRLRGWLEDDVEGQRILHHLAAAAEAWDSMGRPDSELYRGARLAKVLAWRRSAAAQLTGAERTFLDRSAALARAEEQLAWEQARRQRRTNQRLRLMLAAACALLLVAAAAGVYALRQNHVAGAAADQARHAATVADSRRLGARALIANDISESLLLAVAGLRRDDSPETRSDLAAALQKRPLLARSFRSGHGTPASMDVSPDGGTVATGVDQGQVWLDDTATGRAVGHYEATSDHTGFHAVIPRFSPDGRFLAVGLDFADRAPLRLLDPRDLRPVTPALDLGPAVGGQVEQVDFSPGGDHLAAVVNSGDGSQVLALVWDLAHPDQPPERVDLDPVDQGLALGPRGRVVYTQQPLTAYDVRTGRQLWRRPVKGYLALDLNRTGTQLAMERWDDKKNNEVLLVDARNGHIQRTLVGQAEQVLKVRFSSNGRLLASSAFDGSLVVWDTGTGEVRERMQGAPYVTALALSPDAHTLYSAGGSEPVRVWDLNGDRRFLSKQSSSPALPMYSSSMWPTQNASKFAYFWANDRGTFVRFVDTSSGHATADRNTHQDGSFAAGRWSPDSLRWATGDGRGRLLVFDPSNARQVASGKVLPGLIDEVEYTADGRSLVAVDDHGRVRVADATTLRPTSPVLDLGDWGCCVAAAPHSHRVVVFTSRSGNDGVQGDARHWAVVDTDSARIVRQGTVPSAVFYSDWSPDGKTIVGVGAGNRVLAIDERSGRVRVSAPASQNTDSYWVRFSRDGRELVSAAINGSVSLWDSHLRLLGTVTTPQEVPAAAGFSPDGRVLIGSLDGGIYSWDPSARHAMAFACRAAGRRLTHLEWRDNFGTQAYQDLCPR